jgi:hypothetical protein
MTWGTANGTNDNRLYIEGGLLKCGSGSNIMISSFIADGNWHFIVVTHDNNDNIGNKRKLYVDGRLVLTQGLMASVTLGTANKFVIGSSLTSTGNFFGQIDAAFVVGVALSFEEIVELYNVCGQDLAPSPKNVGDHVEAVYSDVLLATFDTLDTVSKVDLKVAV